MRDLKRNGHCNADGRAQSIPERAIEHILDCDIKSLSELTTETVATHLCISATHLLRVFRKEEGLTLREFITREKIFRCVALMSASPNISIENLAKIFGFSSANYFIKIFKTRIGTTPGIYRKILEKSLTYIPNKQ